MKNILFIPCVIAALLHSGATRIRAEAGPYEGGKFKGRIAWSADGNHNDPDDWAASPLALAILAECGARDRLVHFDYNSILPQTNPDWEKIHAESVLGAVEKYGFDKSVFHDCRKSLDRAVKSITKAINDSSAGDPLYFIIAGPRRRISPRACNFAPALQSPRFCFLICGDSCLERCRKLPQRRKEGGCSPLASLQRFGFG